MYSLIDLFIADLCPKPNVTDNPLSKKSHVEDFSEPVPGLFQALTTEPDEHERWITITYPVDFDVTQFQVKPEKEINFHMREFYDFFKFAFSTRKLYLRGKFF